MRIVTWNCGGALRRKRTALVSLDADVLVIQECENPALSADQSYCDWAGQQRALWVGRSKDKGLGVFARPGLSLEAVALDDAGLQLFLPCRIEGMSLLAVWTKKSDSDTYNYIGQLWLWLQRHAGFLAGARSLLVGDLNSNTIWDRKHRGSSHSDVVRLLEAQGLHSLHHQTCGELHGQESVPTFFLHRNPARPYHIDYAFLSTGLQDGARLVIGQPADWLMFSDHMPVVVDLAPSP